MTDKGKEPALTEAAAEARPVFEKTAKVKPLRLLVEGWTKYAHSYAHVNLHQLVALARFQAEHPEELHLYYRESPPFVSKWPVYESAFPTTLTREEDALVKSIERYPEDDSKHVDVIYRMNFGHDLTLPRDPLTTKVVVFFTAEFGKLTHENFAEMDPKLTGDGSVVEMDRFRALVDRGLFFGCVPAEWNLRAFIEKEEDRAGDPRPVIRRYVDTGCIGVIPHGVDTSKLYPDVDGRKRLRVKLGLGATDFAFLHVGAMTMNKNVLHILKCFYDVALKNDFVRLVLKANSSMYACQQQISSYINYLMENGHIDKKTWEDNVGKRVHMIDGNLDFESMRWLFSACDCYLAPYMGEGFNLPVLEAMACGLPLIVTKGGATDDFVHPDCAMLLSSKMEDAPPPGGKWLVSAHDELSRLMEQMCTPGADDGKIASAQNVGPDHVQAHFSWKQIVEERMLPFLRSVAATNATSIH
jgi:glycosyltransferase involved in cell wall biosynthesis